MNSGHLHQGQVPNAFHRARSAEDRPVLACLIHLRTIIYTYGMYSFMCLFNTYISGAYIRTCVHTYIHTYIHTYMHTYMHTCIRTYIHTYIYLYKYIHTYMHSCRDIRARIRRGLCGCVVDGFPVKELNLSCPGRDLFLVGFPK